MLSIPVKVTLAVAELTVVSVIFIKATWHYLTPYTVTAISVKFGLIGVNFIPVQDVVSFKTDIALIPIKYSCTTII